MKTFFSFACLVFFSILITRSAQAQVSGSKPFLYTYFHNSSSFGITPAINGDTIGGVRFKALASGTGNIRTGAAIDAFIDGPVGPSSLPTSMVFRTGTNGLHNRMIVDKSGLVGIGTMSPAFDLHVVGNTHTSGDFFGRIHFDQNTATDDAPDTYIDEAYFENKQRTILGLPAGPGAFGGLLSLAPGNNSFDHQLFFGDDGIFTRRFAGNAPNWAGAAWHKLLTGEDINGTPNRIAKFTGPNSIGDSRLFDDGANVGIGTATPDAAYLLTVQGDARINGQIRATGDASVGNNLSVANNATVLNRMSVGTATMGTGFALSVRGGVITDEVLVQLSSAWPDYVFAPGYALAPLSEVENFVRQNRHLPGITPAAKVETTGLNLGETQKAQMEKIENIYLYLIDMEKRISALEKENTELKMRLNRQ